MAGNLPGDPSLDKFARHLANIQDSEDLDCYARRWYFSKQEIEESSPSRKDGIGEKEESYFRKLYCSFLQELGMELKVPQQTIATAMLMCHRFYMRQSHAKNCWQTIATACMFLGCKVGETSRWLNEVIVVAYKLLYKWDPSASRRIKQKEVHDIQKDLILKGERLLLATLAFNMNIEHPYKPLVGALKKLEITDKELARVAWNYVNDWLRTTLCLQYKPHYIAAGSIFLAAKILKVKLPKGWWLQFDIAPRYLEEVVQQMIRVVEQNQKRAQQSMRGKGTAPETIAKKALSSSSESCTLNGPVTSSSCVLKTTEYAEGPKESVSVSSKCDKKQVSCVVQDFMKETSLHSSTVTEKTSSSSLQVSTPSGSLSSGVLVSMASGAGHNGSVLSKCNEINACSDVPDSVKEAKLQCQASESGSADSVVEDCEDQPVREKSDLNLSCKIVSIKGSSSKMVKDCEDQPVREKSDLNLSCKIVSIEGSNSMIDVDRIRELRKRKRDIITNRKLSEDQGNAMDSEAWIEREIENGIQPDSSKTDKQRRL
ncbi:cyclin-T1-4-like [Apium graveolens]|uniref:cyclin-T1-4-like n=1 Tax=Apium graveolens TaxID=4045 RepID=UPI003D78F788